MQFSFLLLIVIARQQPHVFLLYTVCIPLESIQVLNPPASEMKRTEEIAFGIELCSLRVGMQIPWNLDFPLM